MGPVFTLYLCSGFTVRRLYIFREHTSKIKVKSTLGFYSTLKFEKHIRKNWSPEVIQEQSEGGSDWVGGNVNEEKRHQEIF